MRMKALFAAAVAAFLCCIQPVEAAVPSSANAQFKIVTASARGTYIRIGRDIAAYVAPAAGIALEVLPSAGSAENVRRLRHEPGVKFAIIQSDVYQAFLDASAAGDREAATLIKPLRVIIPLQRGDLFRRARRFEARVRA